MLSLNKSGGWFDSLLRRKSKLYSLHINDMEIMKDLEKLLEKLKYDVASLQAILGGDNVTEKFAKMAELETSFRLMKIKIDAISKDLSDIRNIEMQNRDFIYLNDDDSLRDKIENINNISELLDRLLELVRERPSSQDLKSEYLIYIKTNVSAIEESLNSIISDDKQLETVYSRLNEL